MTSEPPPALTRLQMVVHDSPSGARSLVVSFLVHTQALLLPDFDAAAHDAALAHAHAAGHVPVGPVLVRTEPWDGSELEQGTPDRPVRRSWDEMKLKVEAVNGNIVKVIADMEIGASLA